MARRKKKGTFIRVKYDTKAILIKLGRKNESYDDTIKAIAKQAKRVR
jgi:hypothetical protein